MKFFQTLTNTINPFIFLLAFCVGIFFTYIFTSNPDIIYINPNPHNQDVVYKDDNDKCFRYTAEVVKCTKDAIDVNKSKDFKDRKKQTKNENSKSKDSIEIKSQVPSIEENIPKQKNPNSPMASNNYMPYSLLNN